MSQVLAICRQWMPSERHVNCYFTVVLVRERGGRVFARMGQGPTGWVAQHGESLSRSLARAYFPSHFKDADAVVNVFDETTENPTEGEAE